MIIYIIIGFLIAALIHSRNSNRKLTREVDELLDELNQVNTRLHSLTDNGYTIDQRR